MTQQNEQMIAQSKSQLNKMQKLVAYWKIKEP